MFGRKHSGLVLVHRDPRGSGTANESPSSTSWVRARPFAMDRAGRKNHVFFGIRQGEWFIGGESISASWPTVRNVLMAAADSRNHGLGIWSTRKHGDVRGWDLAMNHLRDQFTCALPRAVALGIVHDLFGSCLRWVTMKLACSERPKPRQPHSFSRLRQSAGPRHRCTERFRRSRCWRRSERVSAFQP